MKKKLFFVVNGKIKNYEKTISEIEIIFKEKYSLKILSTSKKGNGIAQTLQAVKLGADYIIATGGDGTMNEVINGIMLSKPESDKVIVGLLPRGTGNDFA